MNGWAIFLADVLVMASLSDIAAIYTFKLFGFSELSESKWVIIVAAVLWIVLYDVDLLPRHTSSRRGSRPRC